MVGKSEVDKRDEAAFDGAIGATSRVDDRAEKEDERAGFGEEVKSMMGAF